jgi:hypothetical protein
MSSVVPTAGRAGHVERAADRLDAVARGALGIVVGPGRTAGLEYERADVAAAQLPPAAHRKAAVTLPHWATKVSAPSGS